MNRTALNSHIAGIAIGCHAVLVNQCMPVLRKVAKDFLSLLRGDEVAQNVDRIIMVLKLLR